MSNVVSLHPREPMVWTCQCGCMTHYAYDDGSLECASCGNVACSEDGNWLRNVPDAPDDAPEAGEGTFSRTDVDFGNAELALRRVLKAATLTDTAVVIVALRDNSSRMWVGDGVDREKIETLISQSISGAATAGKFANGRPAE